MMPPGVPPIALFRTVAHNPRVLGRWRGGALLDKGSIALRQREIAILRTTARLGAEYEWGVHIAFFADKAELTEAERRATVHAGPEAWSGAEAPRPMRLRILSKPQPVREASVRASFSCRPRRSRR